MQIGFVGLGRMGGNMVAPIQPRLRPRGRGVRLRRRGCRPARGARRHRRRLAGELVVQARAAAHGLDHGPRRRADAADGRRARRAARRGDAIVDGGNSNWTDDKRRAAALRAEIHYVDVGTSGGVGASRSATA